MTSYLFMRLTISEDDEMSWNDDIQPKSQQGM